MGETPLASSLNLDIYDIILGLKNDVKGPPP